MEKEKPILSEIPCLNAIQQGKSYKDMDKQGGFDWDKNDQAEEVHRDDVVKLCVNAREACPQSIPNGKIFDILKNRCSLSNFIYQKDIIWKIQTMMNEFRRKYSGSSACDACRKANQELIDNEERKENLLQAARDQYIKQRKLKY